MDEIQGRCGTLLVEFSDGTKLVYNKEANDSPYILLMNGKFVSQFETEIDAVQFLLSAGYYKGDERKAVIRK